MNNKKITENDLLENLQLQNVLLSPLIIKSLHRDIQRGRQKVDAIIEIAWRGSEESFRFIVEAKSKSTPMAVQAAINQVQSYTQSDEHPMILVPYLSPERVGKLEEDQVSGIDLCGNGVVIVPNRLYISRSGHPNKYPESRPLNNPYRGKSAMVARMLLVCPQWNSLNELAEAINNSGISLSLSQVSKAVQSLQDDLLVTKTTDRIKLHDAQRLLDKLGSEWQKPSIYQRQALRLSPNLDWPQALSSSTLLQWAVTGESSVKQYTMLTQGGPHKVAVTSLPLALSLLNGTPEPITNFADVELLETKEPGFYFKNMENENQMRWASRIQTWIELQCGDPRQQDVARKVREQILSEVTL